jgi:hypothetical protein
MTPTLTYIIFGICIILLSLASPHLRLRKRDPRCPQCRYSLPTLPNNIVCSECGSPSSLNERTQRHLGWMKRPLLLVGVVLVGTALRKEYLRYDWPHWLPVSWQVASLSFAGNIDSDATTKLLDSISTGSITIDQYSKVVHATIQLIDAAPNDIVLASHYIRPWVTACHCGQNVVSFIETTCPIPAHDIAADGLSLLPTPAQEAAACLARHVGNNSVLAAIVPTVICQDPRLLATFVHTLDQRRDSVNVSECVLLRFIIFQLDRSGHVVSEDIAIQIETMCPWELWVPDAHPTQPAAPPDTREGP